MRKIKQGDEVIITVGKDKGRQGRVLRVLNDDNKVVVQGLNMVKRHTRANPNAGIAGGIVEREAPLHISNVALFNPATGKGERVGIKVLEDGRKVRVFKSSNEQVDA